MQTIYLDISNRGTIPTIYAKQNDVGRKFKVVLTKSGVPYIPENGSVFSVWYDGASGVGNYTDIADRSAFSVSANEVTVEMIVQMLTNAGDGILSLVMNSAIGEQIGFWNVPYVCEGLPGAKSEAAQQYYTAFSKAVEDLPYPDASLTVAGKAADAAATGRAIANVTAETIGRVPGVESVEHAGCYYRIVGGETEWVNPPMVSGVEYRTTERYMGKAVYTKIINHGALAAANTTVTINTGISGDVTNIVDLKLFTKSTTGNTYVYPKHDLYAGTLQTSGLYFSRYQTVIFQCLTDLSTVTAVVILKYTKD